MMKKISSWTITAILLAALMALNVHITVDQPEHGESNTSFIQLSEVLAYGGDVGTKASTEEEYTTVKKPISFLLNKEKDKNYNSIRCGDNTSRSLPLINNSFATLDDGGDDDNGCSGCYTFHCERTGAVHCEPAGDPQYDCQECTAPCAPA